MCFFLVQGSVDEYRSFVLSCKCEQCDFCQTVKLFRWSITPLTRQTAVKLHFQFLLHMASEYFPWGAYHSPPSVTVTSNHDIPRAGSCQEGSCSFMESQTNCLIEVLIHEPINRDSRKQSNRSFKDPLNSKCYRSETQESHHYLLLFIPLITPAFFLVILNFHSNRHLHILC